MSWRSLSIYLSAVSARLQREVANLTLRMPIAAAESEHINDQIEAIRQHIELIETLKITAKIVVSSLSYDR